MYNRYIPNGTAYTRVSVEDIPPPRQQAQERASAQQQQAPPFGAGGGQSEHFSGGGTQQTNPFAGLGKLLPPFLFGKGKEEGGGLSGLLKALKLDSLDSGDILLLLIVLFLLLEGDNLELVIALGLVLIMGLTDDKEKKEGGGE